MTFCFMLMTRVLFFNIGTLINIIEQLNGNFCNWFVDNKLSIHFGEDKTKSILFAPLNKCKKLRKLNISYGSLKIKQYSEVTYLGCILDESLSGESMALNVVSKISLLKKQIFVTSIKTITV